MGQHQPQWTPNATVGTTGDGVDTDGDGDIASGQIAIDVSIGADSNGSTSFIPWIENESGVVETSGGGSTLYSLATALTSGGNTIYLLSSDSDPSVLYGSTSNNDITDTSKYVFKLTGITSGTNYSYDVDVIGNIDTTNTYDLQTLDNTLGSGDASNWLIWADSSGVTSLGVYSPSATYFEPIVNFSSTSGSNEIKASNASGTFNFGQSTPSSMEGKI